eukprot:scaffold128902_cov29-Prasinocladus_malaysianus.AAC.1
MTFWHPAASRRAQKCRQPAEAHEPGSLYSLMRIRCMYANMVLVLYMHHTYLPTIRHQTCTVKLQLLPEIERLARCASYSCWPDIVPSLLSVPALK